MIYPKLCVDYKTTTLKFYMIDLCLSALVIDALFLEIKFYYFQNSIFSTKCVQFLIYL